MENKILNSIVFICSLIALVISLKIFYNMGIFVDEYSLTPSIVYGSEFMLVMAWLRLALLTVTTAISGIKLFTDR